MIPDLQENELSMNIFSTPGPTFVTHRPMYFDSPTEDPSQPDTLEPESYGLDLNALDFQWRPFLRKFLPDHGLTDLPDSNSSLHASDTYPAIFEEPDYLSLHLPSDITYEQAADADTQVDTDFHNAFLRGSLVSGRATQQTSSPQLNGQSAIGAFAPASGIVTPLRNATASPVIPNFADEKSEQVKIEWPMVNPHEGNGLVAFQPELVSAVNRHVKNHEEPCTPPRPTQTSQPATPKKDRQSQPRSTQGPPPQERRSSVSWMLPHRSLAATDTTGREEIEGLLSQQSDTSHDTIESWTDNH